MVRILHTNSFNFIYLNWNLFLAFIPFVLSLIVILFNPTGKKFIFLFLGWVLFFPNAPYMVSDLIYLTRFKPNYSIPIWYDLIMLTSFAFNGIFLGYISFQIFYKKMELLFSKSKTKFIMTFYLMLSGYGIYLGRFARLNSWDILTKPQLILEEIFQTLIHPMQYKSIYILSFLFGTLVCLTFYSIKELTENNNIKL
jgi:uncharacterized membrane protein